MNKSCLGTFCKLTFSTDSPTKTISEADDALATKTLLNIQTITADSSKRLHHLRRECLQLLTEVDHQSMFETARSTEKRRHPIGQHQQKLQPTALNSEENDHLRQLFQVSGQFGLFATAHAGQSLVSLHLYYEYFLVYVHKHANLSRPGLAPFAE